MEKNQKIIVNFEAFSPRMKAGTRGRRFKMKKEPITVKKLSGTIRSYTNIITFFIVLFSLTISVIIVSSVLNQQRLSMQQASTHILDMYNEDEKNVGLIANQLLGTNQKVDNAQHFFSMDIPDYLEYTIDKSDDAGYDYFYLPDRIRNLFSEDVWLKSLSFAFNTSSDIFYSAPGNNGEVVKKIKKKTDNLYFTKVLLSENSDNMIGTLTVSFDKEKYKQILSNYRDIHPLQMIISTNGQQERFITSKRVLKNENDYFTLKRTVAGNTFTIFQPKSDFWISTMKYLSGLWAATALIIFFLRFLLQRLYKNYHHSVESIIDLLHEVKAGNMQGRITQGVNDSELLEISDGINEMLDHINSYVVANYQLENEQKEANFRALQSQINPHFMYNTLEYIRMYAINVNARELADVVFAFSSLLRNNISQEKFTTLEKEISFAEKYAYLYQMRYPDCLAYSFKVEPAVKDKKIPKFIIQPLIENYFIHGVDFERNDNAGVVKAFQRGEHIVIQVIDNGVGMPEAALKKFNEKRFEKDSLSKGKSIGIQNIYERLKLYYNADFSFTISRKEPTGTIITIEIPISNVESEKHV